MQNSLPYLCNKNLLQLKRLEVRVKKDISNLTIEEKIHQMFILGYSGENPLACQNFVRALKNGLGGVIFFTHNIIEKERFKDIVEIIKDNALIKPFLSIDQEGGRVERTLNLYGGSHYLSAKESAARGIDFVVQQTDWISNELNYFGLNMNFAPVLDVNTNPQNPIIAERAYSNNPNEVIKYAKATIETYRKNKIIPVGKHFPGHGDTSCDSHIELPTVNLSKEELLDIHIEPFIELASLLPAIMVAHVHYPAFDKEKIPASISKNIISFLRNDIGFRGVIVSDDMVMGGIRKYSSFEACKRAINAGVNMFIYRLADDSTVELISRLVEAVKSGEIPERRIDESLGYINILKKCC